MNNNILFMLITSLLEFDSKSDTVFNLEIKSLIVI